MRTQYLDLLRELIEPEVGRLVVLKGGLGKKKLAAITANLNEWKDQPHVVLAGVWQVPLVKNLGGGTNRVDLVNLSSGAITETDLRFTRGYAITGMGNTHASRLEDLVFFFTDTNKQILEANTTLGVVTSYEISGFEGSGDYTDVCFFDKNLYVSTDFAQVLGYVGVVREFSPSDSDPAHTEDGVAIAWLRANGITNDFETAGALDPDHDGYTTAQEYIFNTCPTNALSRLDLMIRSTALEFVTATGRVYSVEALPDLTSNIWNIITNNIPGTGNPISIPLNSPEPTAFFCVNVDLQE